MLTSCTFAFVCYALSGRTAFLLYPRMAQLFGVNSFHWRLMFGMLSLFGIQTIISPRRLVAFRLAWQQLVRKKRQTALLMAGLMIGSAIISSSLIVGDSLDETVREEVDAAWGETDVLVSGFDPTIGQVSEISQSIVDQLRDANVEEINYIQAGRVLSASVVTSEGILIQVCHGLHSNIRPSNRFER